LPWFFARRLGFGAQLRQLRLDAGDLACDLGWWRWPAGRCGWLGDLLGVRGRDVALAPLALLSSLDLAVLAWVAEFLARPQLGLFSGEIAAQDPRLGQRAVGGGLFELDGAGEGDQRVAAAP